MTQHHYRYVQTKNEQGVLVLTASPPRIQDEDLAMAVREDLLQALTESGAKKVVLNLEHVQQMSSVAFWPLLSLHRKLKESSGRLLLCNLQPGVSEVLHVTRMISTGGTRPAPFEEAADVEAAVAQLNAE
jgi:anti-anti-sigma factor